MEPTIVTSSPSSTQVTPSATTTSRWKLLHGSRSIRAGMSVVICGGVGHRAPKRRTSFGLRRRVVRLSWPRWRPLPVMAGAGRPSHAFGSTGTARRGWCASAHHDDGRAVRSRQRAGRETHLPQRQQPRHQQHANHQHDDRERHADLDEIAERIIRPAQPPACSPARRSAS